jgi:hypothetical protein
MANREKLDQILTKHEEDMRIAYERLTIERTLANENAQLRESITEKTSEILNLYGGMANIRETKDVRFQLANGSRSFLKLIGLDGMQGKTGFRPNPVVCIERASYQPWVSPTILFRIDNGVPFWHGEVMAPTVENLQNILVVLDAMREELFELK